MAINCSKNKTGIPLVKFFQVFAMIFSHTCIWAFSYDDTVLRTGNYLYWFVSKLMILGFIQLSIPITAGIVFRDEIDKFIFKHQVLSFPFKKVFYLFFYFALFETVVNLLAFELSHAMDWDILKFIGLSFMIIILIGKRSILSLLFLAWFFIIGTPIMHEFLGENGGVLSNILIGNTKKGFFWPLFPWFGCVAFGFLLMHYYKLSENKKRFHWICLGLGVLCCLIFHLYFGVQLELGVTNIWGSKIFQPPLNQLLGLFGYYLVLFSFCSLVAPEIKLAKYGIVNSYSKGIIWVFAVHSIVIHRLFYVYDSFFQYKSYGVYHMLFKFFFFVPLSIGIGWFVGAQSIKLFQEKRMVLRLRRLPN